MNNNKFLYSAFGLAVANIMLVAVGVILMPTVALAVVWAIGCLVLHFVLLVYVAHYELMQEFGPNGTWVKEFEARMLNR